MNGIVQNIKNKEFSEPLLLAVVLHIAFLVLAMFIPLSGLPENMQKNRLSFHLKGGSSNRTVTKKQFTGTEGPEPKAIRFSGENTANALQALKSASPDLAVIEPKKAVDNAGEIVQKEKDEPVSYVNKNLESILMDTQRRIGKDEAVVKPKSAAAFYHEKTAENVKVVQVTGQNLLRTLGKPLDRIVFYSPRNVSIDPEEGMPGFTPSNGEGSGQGPGWGTGHGTGQGPWEGPGQGTSNMELGGGPGESLGDIVKYESVDNFLDIDVYTYQDPKSGEKYFMIKIFAKKDQKAFKVMPKEVIFTVDASLSISKDRLDEFKRGIAYCLAHLNKGDTFNIVAFKDKTSFFSPHSVPATPETVKRAERFVSDLTSNQQTDVYAAFKKILELSLDRKPSSVMLLSDGRPTHGVVDSRELINSITRINQKTRPIFAFTGGVRVNRYLLDFIAYQNRAWSQFVRSTSDIHKALGEFYDKIKDPLFINLRYRLNNVDEREVFPKSLPDFYRNAEFTLYGSYKDEDTFSMQLLGDIEGKTKELVFTRSLKDSKKGTEDIMRGYAFNKIYYLISRMTDQGVHDNTLKEIEALSRRYGITTPYSPELQKVERT